ncbi:MAG: CPBP family intramembrane glutamic endopeptidase [Halobacteriota archaeon]
MVPPSCVAIEASPLWVAVTIGLGPLALVSILWVVSNSLVRRFGWGDDTGGTTELVYAAAVTGCAVVVSPWTAACTAPFVSIDVPIGVAAVGTVGAGCGAGLYVIDDAIWRWYTPGAVRRTNTTHRAAIARLGIPPGEEVLFRAVPTVLVGVVGAIGYVVGSAVVFGVAHAHVGRHEVAFKTCDGVVYAIALVGTGSLLAPIAMHVGYNVASILARTNVFGRSNGA